MNLIAGGVYVGQKSEKKLFSYESYAIVPWLGGFGPQNRNLGVFFLDKEVPKTIFKLQWPGLPHNLG